MLKHTFRVTALFIVCCVVISTTPRAEWICNGTPIAGYSYDQRDSQIVPDGLGGAIVTWQGTQPGSYQWSIYAQRIDIAGNIQWASDAVVICAEERTCNPVCTNMGPYIASGGSGEAIITWRDSRNYPGEIYAQKIDIDGNLLWSPGGVLVADSVPTFCYPIIVSNGNDGAIVAWINNLDGDVDIYAQNISSTGIPQWEANGVIICNAPESQYGHIITTDMSGGAILAWRADNITYDIYAQRIDSLGNICWAADGVNVTTLSGYKHLPQIASNGDGGVIITWHSRYSPSYDQNIYAQQIDRNGNKLWGAEGISICSYSDYQYSPIIVADNLGGATIAWGDSRNGNSDIYIQKVDSYGSLQWHSDGIPVCIAPENQYQYKAITSYLGETIITWVDQRNGDKDIYAQKININGIPLWQANGVGVCTAIISEQIRPQIISDYLNGAIITWDDHRLGQYDIYAQKANSDGSVVTDTQTPHQALELYQNYPNPFNPTTTIQYALPFDSRVKLSVYDIAGREVICLVNTWQPEGQYSIGWNGKNNSGNQVRSGIYFYRLSAKRTEITKKMVLLR